MTATGLFTLCCTPHRYLEWRKAGEVAWQGGEEEGGRGIVLFFIITICKIYHFEI